MDKGKCPGYDILVVATFDAATFEVIMTKYSKYLKKKQFLDNRR